MKEMGQLEELSFPDGRHVSVITTLDGLLNGHHRHQNGHNGHHPPHNGHNDHMTTNGHHGGQSRDQNIENNSTGTGFDTADGDSGVEQIQNEISRVSPIPNLNHQEIKQENYYAESGYTSSINSTPSNPSLAQIQEQQPKFDPTTHHFSPEELKPTPIQKKSRKQLVREEDKDEKYWDKRRKNNQAAKRSREARRSRENQISMRASFLEKDNAMLKEELLTVKEELQSLREKLLLVTQQSELQLAKCQNNN